MRENPPEKKPRIRRCEDPEDNLGRERQGHRGDGGTWDRRSPQGLTRTWKKSEGGKGGEHTVTVNGGRHRHVERGTDTSSRGWRVAGAGDVQMGGALRRERRWGAVANRERGTKMNGCLWWGSSMEEVK